MAVCITDTRKAPLSPARAGNRGFAMISVLLVIMIFFIITVAISTIVVLQARIHYETSMSDMAYYLSDAGIRYADSRAIYNFFLRYKNPSPTISDETISITNLSPPGGQYSSEVLITLYAMDNPNGFGSLQDIYFTHSYTVASTALIRTTANNALVARRTMYADIYLGDTLSIYEQTGTVDYLPGGMVKSAIKRCYQKNR